MSEVRDGEEERKEKKRGNPRRREQKTDGKGGRRGRETGRHGRTMGSKECDTAQATQKNTRRQGKRRPAKRGERS